MYSLETEYALVPASQGNSGEQACSGAGLYESAGADAVGRPPCAVRPHAPACRARETALAELREGYFLANGARVYCDSGHLEWAAPEAADPRTAVVYDKAGERELGAAAHAAWQGQTQGPRVMVVKNNLDYLTNVTYGCHENYSVNRVSRRGNDVFRGVAERLVAFLVTRQVLCGAGRLGSSCEPDAVFQLSQRADFMTTVSSVDTRENRPIVNLRDEPLAGRAEQTRLHLILGDSNLAEYPNFLKLGMTGLLLEMLENDAEPARHQPGGRAACLAPGGARYWI